MRSEFVANVSHELKTPITTIKGYIETLREGALREPDKAAQFLDTVARHADRLNAIVEDLLSLSRIESDARSIAMEPLDLRDVMARSVAACRSRAAARNMQLVSAVPPDPVPVMGNANLLEQALGNVLDNAIKFSAEGKTVKVSLARSGKAASVEVADEGVGIPAADLPHVFERFYRVDKARSRELGGTGLGLAIVKHIVLAHKGEVAAQSTPGKGSVFTLRLPLHLSA
jgi:two-component system phosphate regulon sensor histidine kinase PhoR